VFQKPVHGTPGGNKKETMLEIERKGRDDSKIVAPSLAFVIRANR
jgi:hypothetical protein